MALDWNRDGGVGGLKGSQAEQDIRASQAQVTPPRPVVPGEGRDPFGYAAPSAPVGAPAGGASGGTGASGQASSPASGSKGTGKKAGLMAALNRPIGGSGKGKAGKAGRGRKGDGLPTKRGMNLYQSARQATDGRKLAITAAALAVGVALFAKFAVMGPLQQVSDKQAELAQVQAQLQPLQEAAADYDSTLAEYNQYAPVSSTTGVDTKALMDMVEQQVMPYATVSQESLEDDTLTLTLSNVSLTTVGQLATILQGQTGVESVSVATAQTPSDSASGDTSSVVATVTVKLVTVEASDSGEGTSSGTSSSTSGGGSE